MNKVYLAPTMSIYGIRVTKYLIGESNTPNGVAEKGLNGYENVESLVRGAHVGAMDNEDW